ncbi:MAG TPA: hypothetical protein VK430_00975 [Xanthobacteraceae bacterium]|nr:hypothetical protein [Xanthobacteraceae bacterium]
MRVVLSLLVACAVHALAGCAQIAAQDAATKAAAKFAQCGAENRTTQQSQMLSGRLWTGGENDTVAKLLDPNPLTPAERDALVQVHHRAVQCRQIIIAHADQYAAWQVPFFQDYAQRADAIYDRLASGELSVGLANKLSIENDRKLEADLASGHAYGVRTEEVERQRKTDAMLEESSQIAAAQSQPRMGAANCAWLGNTLDCTRMR